MAKRSGWEYGEGDVFAVPLRDGGWVVGVLARHEGSAAVGYFFGPRRRVIPNQIPRLRPEDALVVERFGDLGLLDGDWPALGRVPDWDRWQWPIPEFARVEPLTGRAWRVHYPDDDPSALPTEEPICQEDCEQLPRDVSAGAGAVEVRLTALLQPASEDYPEGPVAHARSLDWRSIVRAAQDRLSAGGSRSLSVVADTAHGAATSSGQAVKVQVRLANDQFGSDQDRVLLDVLEAGFVAAAESSGNGEFDGVETGMGYATFFLYGADADSLFAAIEPVLEAAELRSGSYAVKRYGPSGSTETRVKLS